MANDIGYTPTQQDVDTALQVLEFMRNEEMNRLQGMATPFNSVEMVAADADGAIDIVRALIHRGWERLQLRLKQ